MSFFMFAFTIGKSSPRPDSVQRPSPGCNLILQKWSLGLTLSIGVFLMSNYGSVCCVTCFNLRLSSCWFSGDLPGAFEDKNTTLYWFSCLSHEVCLKCMNVLHHSFQSFQRVDESDLHPPFVSSDYMCGAPLMILGLYHPPLLRLWMSLNRGQGFVTLKYCHLESSVWKLSSLIIKLIFFKRGPFRS